VAATPTEDLKTNEEEWANIPGAGGLGYAFVVADGMQAWRWRLRVSLPEGEAVYSEEMTLPDIAARNDKDKSAEEPEEAALPEALPEDETLVETPEVLPVANITFTANVPNDEITIGTEITLLSEIENPREGMLLQWQYLPADAEGTKEVWQDIPEATGDAYTYALNEENAGWLWRLLITVAEKETPEETLGEPPEEEIEETDGTEGAATDGVVGDGEEAVIPDGTEPVEEEIIGGEAVAE
jgi:hypothetical protein